MNEGFSSSSDSAVFFFGPAVLRVCAEKEVRVQGYKKGFVLEGV